MITPQSQAQSRRPSTVIGPVTLGGTVGLLTEAYSASGISARRPNGSGRLFGNTSASALGARFGLDFLISTEDDQLRQSQNRIALTTAYHNWAGTIGDFNPVISKYGLNGATLRGAMVEYAPRNLTFSFMAGRSRRAIDDGISALIRRPALPRRIVAARAGLGNKNRNYAQISGLMARDLDGSAPENAIRPAENVSFTPEFGVLIMENKLAVKGELTASAFTGDTRAARTPDGPAPSLLGLFTPRIGSQFDFAGSLSARYTNKDFPESIAAKLDQITILTSYDRVEPGFISLGRPYTRSDQAIFRLQPQARLLKQKLQLGLDFTSRRNNLDKSRIATLKRNQIGLTTQAQLSPTLFLNGSYQWLANTNTPLVLDPMTQMLKQRLISKSFMLAPSLTLPVNGLNHRFSLTAIFQSLSDKTERTDAFDRPGINFDNRTTTLGHAVILNSGLSINSNVSQVSSKSVSSDVKAFGFNTGGSYSFFKRKLNVGLNAGFSRTKLAFERFTTNEEEQGVDIEKSMQWTFSLNSTYRVTIRDVLRFTVRGLSTDQPLRGDFREFQSTLRFEHRF